MEVPSGPLNDIADGLAEAVDIPPGAIEAARSFFKKNAFGFAGSIALTCKGPECPLVDICPLTESGEAYPLGKPCPFEQGLIQMWVNKHLEALGIEDWRDPEYSFDLDLLYQIAAHELIKWRAANHLSKRPLIEERVIGYSHQGDEIFAEIISPALQVIDSQNKILLKLKEALLATRKAKVDAGRMRGDPSSRASDRVEEAKRLATERLKDADYEIRPGD